MSTLGQFFSTGGGGGIYQQKFFTSSGTFTAPVDGKYLVTAIGGGGGGGANNGRGGGAGGLSQSLVKLTAGTVISFTIGAGGTGNTLANGTNGGNTTCTATGLSLTANGGNGGNNTTDTAGGTASGGNIMNVTGGGASGPAGNGGAVGVWGTTPSLGTSSVSYSSLFSSVTKFGTLHNGTSESGYRADIGNGLLNGRLLQPFGNPNAGGTPGILTSAGSGIFVGGFGPSASGSGGPGGQFGGGGGGAGVSAGNTGGAGGTGVVIIEYFL